MIYHCSDHVTLNSSINLKIRSLSKRQVGPIIGALKNGVLPLTVGRRAKPRDAKCEGLVVWWCRRFWKKEQEWPLGAKRSPQLTIPGKEEPKTINHRGLNFTNNMMSLEEDFPSHPPEKSPAWVTPWFLLCETFRRKPKSSCRFVTNRTMK